MLANGRPGVGRHVLVARRIRGGSVHDRRVGHRTGLVQHTSQRGYGRALLTDGNVDAADLLFGIATLPGRPLVDDRVDGNGGFAGLAVADDQLPLAPSDLNHAATTEIYTLPLH